MKRVHCDNWKHGAEDGISILNPSWEEVEALIQDLDGTVKTLVTFGDYDMGYYMAIGGGPEQYILYLSFDDEERILELINPEEETDKFMELVVGGQRGRFPQRMCIQRKTALIAARTFYETQAPDSSLCWKE